MRVSLYAAETHRRMGREEVLLSRLFGSLDILDRKSYLGSVLRSAGIEIPPDEYRSVQIQFWPEMGPASPDVVLESDSLLVFVVGRDRAELKQEKIRSLVEAGWKLSPRFRLLAITDGDRQPGAVDELAGALPPRRENPCRWLAWAEIFRTLHRRLADAGDRSPARGVIDDFLGLLAAEGLAPFVGFDPASLRSYRESLPAYDRLSAAVRHLASDLDRRLPRAGIRRISTREEDRSLLPARAPRAIHLEYADESWDPRLVAAGRLFLRIDSLSGEVRAGFRCDLSDPAARALLVEGRNRIAEAFGEDDSLRIRLPGGENGAQPERDPSLLARLETQTGAAETRSVEIVTLHDGTGEDLIERLAASLASLRDLAAGIPLLPIHRIDGESPFVVAGQ